MSGTTAFDYERAEQRVANLTMAVGVAGVAVFALRQQWTGGLGFGLGALLSYWNLAGVRKLASKLSQNVRQSGLEGASSEGERDQQAARRPGAGRFVLRFLLLAGALYAIFISHLVPLMAAVAGLFSAPAAVLIEMLIELAQYLR